MGRWIFIFWGLIFSQVLIASSLEIAPVLEKGRFHPLSSLNPSQSLDTKLMLPSRVDPSVWLPLNLLSAREKNFTSYSDSDFKKIRKAYLEGQEEQLDEALMGAYATLAGQPYLTSATHTLTFPSVRQLQAEALYFRYPWTAICCALNALAVVLLFMGWRISGYILAFMGFLLLSFLLGIRIYVLERPPVSNMLETLLFVPWLALLVSFLIKREAVLAAAGLSTLLLGIVAVGTIKDNFENVQAVLDSNYWLTIHVLLVVGSYALFLLAGILAHGYFLGSKEASHKLSGLTQISMYLGLAMLVPGTILGGIWAAQSWGRFWDWDPKESWAFITICAYLAGVHAFRYRIIGEYGLALCAIVGAWTVTFTWYGVNYILGTGLHSYGFGSGGEWIYLVSVVLDAALVLLLAAMAKKRWKTV